MARHGETDWNREGRYQGQRESRLTDLGERQAAALAAALSRERIERVIASPLARCVETARPVARALDRDVETDPLLLKIAHGTWEGRLRAEIERDDPERMRAWREAPDRVRFDGGESLADVLARWRHFAAGLEGDGGIVVVTHDVLVRLAILEGGGRPLRELWAPRVQNGGYARFGVTDAGWSLAEECCDAHLEGMHADTSRQAL